MEKPVWTPKNPETTTMAHFIRHLEKKHNLTLPNYAALHAWSIQHPDLFWDTLACFFDVIFHTNPEHILKQSKHMMDTTWFDGATLNVTENLLKRNDNHPALISIDETGKREVLSYHALRLEVAACAAGLRAHGIQAGDRVVGILPNHAFTVISMLATASIGAIWSSCSPDFGIAAATDRLAQITPKILFICDGYTYHGKAYHLQEKAMALVANVPSLKHLVVCPILAKTPDIETWPNSSCWDTFLRHDEPLQTQAFPFNHPWYILFSSGTTGAPKCIVHSTGGVLLQHLKELGLHSNLTSKDTLLFHTTCGWMMWNWMVSGLALGATLVLYDGSPMFPKINRMFQLVSDENVNLFGTGARFLAAIEKRQLKPNEHLTFSALKSILSTGSPLLPEQYDFVHDHISPTVQLSSISGGTDIVSCFALGNPISPVYRGELQCLGLGMDVQIFDDHGESLSNTPGELVCTLPFPSMPLGFWNDPNRSKYRDAYFEHFPNVWAHGDMAARTKHGGLIIYGRSDAVLNPGGVRIGTAEVYRPLENLPEILDSVVIGQPWQGDVRVVLFVKLQKGVHLDEEIRAKIKQIIRKEASPRHVPTKILEVPDIPRTINDKIVEVAVRQTVQGETIKNIGSLANPEALEYFKDRVELRVETI
jgi:acetoacetyl-CoA synthetase